MQCPVPGCVGCQLKPLGLVFVDGAAVEVVCEARPCDVQVGVDFAERVEPLGRVLGNAGGRQVLFD